MREVVFNKSNVVPMPKFFEGEAENVVFLPEIHSDEKEFVKHAEAFAELCEKATGVKLSGGADGIGLKRRAGKAGEYALEITGGGVTLSAADGEGICYGLATLLQLIAEKDGKLVAPECSIEDYPETDYRGYMIQAEAVFSVKQLFTAIDACFYFKLNYLHIHFSDSDGYNLPSDVLPKLGRKALSREDIAKLNAYADARGVHIVPEIDLPGHANYIIKTYPEYFANVYKKGNEPKHLNGTDVTENAICIGNEHALPYLKKLLDEVMELFPSSKYIHIGGDEVLVREWEHCEACRAYMERKGIKSAEELYARTLGELGRHVISRGRECVMWEGFRPEMMEFIPKEVILIAWESYYCLAPDMVKAGHRIINSSWKPLYTVPWGRGNKWTDEEHWGYKDILEWDKYTWKNKYLPASPATLNPVRIEPTELAMGAEVCQWGMRLPETLMTVREWLPAFSERTWTEKRYCTDREFYLKLCKALVNLDAIIDENLLK